MNVRVWWVLLALWMTGCGSAQGSALLGGHASCAANGTPAPAMTGSSSFDMLTFAPDAQCWFNETVVTLATSGVFHAVDGLAAAVMTVLFVTTVLIPFITDPKSRGAKMIISAITYVVFGSITVSAARNEPGNAIDMIRGYMFTGWTSIYVPSANRGSALINASSGTGSVTANLQGIADKIAQLNYDATIFKRREKEVMAIAVSAQATNASATDTASQVDALIKADHQAYGDPSAGPGAWTNIGFFLLLGVFAVFAAIVYSTGLGVIIASLMLSVAFAFAAAGNFSGLKTTLNTTLAAFISTLVVPFTVSVVIAIAFGQPTAAMLRSLTSDSAAIHQSMQDFVTQYQSTVQSCDVTNLIPCTVNNQFAGIGAAISSVWETLRTQMVGMLTIVIGMIVSLGIGLSQLRRVPALIGSMLGVSAGGESSGTGANPLGTIAEALGVVAAGRALGKQMVQKGGKGTANGGGPPAAGPDTSGGGGGGGPAAGGGPSGGGAGGRPSGPSGGSAGVSLPTATPPATVAPKAASPMTASQRAGSFVAGIPTAGGVAQAAVSRAQTAASTAGAAIAGAVGTVRSAPGKAAAAVGAAKDAAVSGVTAARTDIEMGMAARTQRATAARGTPQGNASAAAAPEVAAGAESDMVQRPKVNLPGAQSAGAGTSAAPAASPASPTASGPSAPANTGKYGSAQNRPAPAPSAPPAPPSVGMVNAVGPGVAPAPQAPQPTRVMTNPGGGSMTKATAGADKSVPSSTNDGPSGRNSLPVAKAGVTPTPGAVQNAYRAPGNTAPVQNGNLAAGNASWRSAQTNTSGASGMKSNPAPAAPVTGTPAPSSAPTPGAPSASGSLPPEPDLPPTPAARSGQQARFSPRMDARRRNP